MQTSTKIILSLNGGVVEDLSLVTPSKVKEYRERKNLNMESFAKQLGINRANIWRWEKAESITHQAAALILYVYPDLFHTLEK